VASSREEGRYASLYRQRDQNRSGELEPEHRAHRGVEIAGAGVDHRLQSVEPLSAVHIPHRSQPEHPF
jgi:hypothetical protein